jgi:hypothetical protein
MLITSGIKALDQVQSPDKSKKCLNRRFQMSKQMKMEKVFHELLQVAVDMSTLLSDETPEDEGTPSDMKYYSDEIVKIRKRFYDAATGRPNGEEAAQDLESFVNCMSMREDEEKFVKKVVYGTHSTLNQSLFGLFFKCILEEAKCFDTERYDLRNEASVKACNTLVPHLNSVYLPFV